MVGAARLPIGCVVCAIVMLVARVSCAAPEVSLDGVWQWADEPPENAMRGEAWPAPRFYRGVVFDAEAFAHVVDKAPMEFTEQALARPARFQVPMPDGTFQDFDIWESPVMEPGLAAQLPGVKTWAGQGVDDPTATLRMDLTPQGFHAQVLSAEGSFYVDPFARGDTTFLVVYDSKDSARPGADGWTCHSAPPGHRPLEHNQPRDLNRSGTFLQTYRLACAATGEYTTFHGGTVALAQAAIVTLTNRVTGVFEREAAIRLVLVANNTSIIYTNSLTDPYTDGDTGAMLTQNQNTVNAVIGPANYDIGHVVGGLNGGGRASVQVPCIDALKSRAASTLSPPANGDFFTALVCHEMGHQFGTLHSFNGTNGGCGPNWTAQDAFEPGSGNTIMSYVGICGADDLQFVWDLYYSSESFEDILEYTTGATGGCPANVVNGNTVPSVSAGPDYTIPRQTPFILTGTGSDINGDTITYCWEQRDLGGQQGAIGGVIADLGSGPIIRSFLPTLSPVRVVPRVSNLLTNTFTIGEALPNTNRALNFRLTARDNRAGGSGVNTDDMVVTCTTSAGPFRLLSPNGGGTLSGNITVTWSVANTHLAPVNCANVKIELSSDGGNTWPTTLAASTPNDGSQLVSLPSNGSTTARIRISGVNNIFFDISDSNFALAAPPGPGAFNLSAPINGATEVELSPVLSWAASSGALSYALTVDTEPAFAFPTIMSINTGFTSYVVPPGTLSEGITYYWRVVANNASGSTPGTPTPASFTTLAPPPALCDGDADADGDRDFADITEVLTFFGFDHSPAMDGPGDASHDGPVNFADITAVLTSWSLPCGK